MCKTNPEFAVPFLEYRQSQLGSVAQSCPNLTPWTEARQVSLDRLGDGIGFPIRHQLQSLYKLMSIRLVIPSNHLILYRPLLLLPSIFPQHLFHESVPHMRCQSTGASASASVLPMNILDRFPLGWTGWISLQSKGLSRVFSNTTVQKHQYFGTQLSLQSKSSIHDYWKNHSFD